MDEHVCRSIDKALNSIKIVFTKAAERIEALSPGQKIIATGLAAEIGKEIGMTGPQVYPTLLFLLKSYEGIEVKKGAHGGIFKLPPSIKQEIAEVISFPTTEITNSTVEEVINSNIAEAV